MLFHAWQMLYLLSRDTIRCSALFWGGSHPPPSSELASRKVARGGFPDWKSGVNLAEVFPSGRFVGKIRPLGGLETRLGDGTVFYITTAHTQAETGMSDTAQSQGDSPATSY